MNIKLLVSKVKLKSFFFQMKYLNLDISLGLSIR